MDYRVHRKGRWFWVLRYHSDTTYDVIEYFPSEDDALGHIELLRTRAEARAAKNDRSA